MHIPEDFGGFKGRRTKGQSQRGKGNCEDHRQLHCQLFFAAELGKGVDQQGSCPCCHCVGDAKLSMGTVMVENSDMEITVFTRIPQETD